MNTIEESWAVLEKIALLEGKKSSIAVGEKVIGMVLGFSLNDQIFIQRKCSLKGKSVEMMQTSTVTEIVELIPGKKFHITTLTGIYSLELESPPF